MTMNKDAIKHIQETANVAQYIEQVSKTDVPVAVIPESHGLTSLEKFMPNRARFRGGFTTSFIEDFAKYVKAYEQEGTSVYVNEKEMTARAFIDLGTEKTPGHAEHKASIDLDRTAAFKVLCNDIHEERHDQKSLAEFVEDYAEFITPYDTQGEVMTTVEAAKSIRDMTIKSSRELNSQVRDMGYTASALESVDASGRDRTVGGFVFDTITYTGLSERSFDVRMSIITKGEDLAISTRIKKFEQHKEEIAAEFKGEIVKALEETCAVVYMGEGRY